VRDIALYFPYMDVQDDTWLKAAALYWARLGCLAPTGFAQDETRTAHILREELGFFVDIDPERYGIEVARAFLEFLEKHRLELLPLYATSISDNVHHSKYMPLPIPETYISFAREVESAGFGFFDTDEEGAWLDMHPRLGEALVAALVGRIAQANDLAVVTDQPDLHGTVSSGIVETLARSLFDDSVPNGQPARASEEIARLYAVAAIRTVVPAGLERVPVERIVRARKKLAAEFDEFLEHIDTLTDHFAELACIEDPKVLQARLELMVNRDLRRSTDDLERGLRQLGLEPAQGVLSLKSLELPAVSAAAASGIGLPAAIGQTGLIAARLITSSTRAHKTSQEKRRSAAGYLLGLRRQLTPQSVVDKVRQTLRREN
jgi:hypothetical protein